MNLLNYFNTFDGLPDTVNNCANGVGGVATDCRGADTAAEFARQEAGERQFELRVGEEEDAAAGQLRAVARQRAGGAFAARADDGGKARRVDAEGVGGRPCT